jgi:hypothetical protein
MLASLTIMGGCMGMGNTGPVVEFNIQTDPEAAHIVFNCPGLNLVMVPLEVMRRKWCALVCARNRWRLPGYSTTEQGYSATEQGYSSTEQGCTCSTIPVPTCPYGSVNLVTRPPSGLSLRRKIWPTRGFHLNIMLHHPL